MINIDVNQMPILLVLGKSMLILLVTAFAAYIVKTAVTKALSYSDARLVHPLRILASLLVWVMGILVLIGSVGIPIMAIVIVFASFAFAVGLAVRETLGNMFARPIIDIFSWVSKGKSLRIGDEQGVVTDLNPFYTVILTKANKAMFIPNIKFLTTGFTVELAKAGKDVIISEQIPKNLDIVIFENMLLESMAKIKGIAKKPAPVLAISGFRKGAQEVSIIFNLSDLKNRVDAIRDVKKAIKSIIDEQLAENDIKQEIKVSKDE